MKKNIVLAAFFFFAACSAAAAQWRALSPGLEFGQFRSPLYGPAEHAVISILRVDTKYYELRLFNASHPSQQGEALTARQWGVKEGLTAVINAAMYQTDYLTSVSYMRTSAHTNNPRVSKDKTFLMFEPLRADIPPVRIVDTDCDNFEQARAMYGSVVQSIRMISCTGRNVWQENNRRWSIAAAGMDTAGHLLFIHSTAPHSVHEFINVLRGLPISIQRAMYMEGGSPSQMYIAAPADTMEFIGDFTAGGRSLGAPRVPNVIGVRKR